MTSNENSAGPVITRFYRPELDLVRLSAFLLVYLHHVLPNSAEEYAGTGLQNFAHVCAALASVCAYGLSLFFALSAYLITELLLREKTATGSVHVRNFYARRVLRIWPLYFFAISLGVAYALFRRSPADLWRMLAYLFLMGNWFCVIHGWSLNCMTHLWSISVEEQFYLIWPGITKHQGKLGMLVCCWVSLASANGMLFFLGRRHSDIFSTVWANSFVQFEMFAGGILLAITLGGKIPRISMSGRIFILCGACAGWFVSVYFCNAFGIGHASSGLALMTGYALDVVGCVAIIYAALGADVSKVSSVFLYLGKISYGLYVFHLLGLLCAKALLLEASLPPVLTGFLRAALGLGFTVLLAMVSYHFLEVPFLKMKPKFTSITNRPI